MKDQWWEIEIQGSRALEDSAFEESTLEDLIFWELQAAGCLGTASFHRDGRPVICGYLPRVQVQEADIQAIAQELNQTIQALGLPPAPVRWSIVMQEDWANSWKDYWHTQPVGERFLIHPQWLPEPPHSERLLIRLDPGMAFGTGTHATTQLCLEALEEQYRSADHEGRQERVADIGCGTGILAIAALLLGAKQVFGVDTDPLAVEAAKACRRLNHLSPQQFSVQLGSVPELVAANRTPVDGLCCNILAEVILRLIPEMTSLVQPQSWAIFSGILQRQAQTVAIALEAQGWQVNQSKHRGDWCVLQATYQP
ncbi:50S ribosomal protein L11 methyltransferase [Lyngbya confervoides]|uniref:Ribosomal protein L11 methyltransferase n=1 Tax=Lyngbya confervoides BDU141951 TaxID=1574623 RepID=A0ABD4T6K3_9CYAN|nr:50S ribosomal protein L11 methyltransferase [Lyngbya confervoides]MCM1984128.1 50S ribosomal protein L11 methyltransferase [Lyngbya confervoides BDU141951]